MSECAYCDMRADDNIKLCQEIDTLESANAKLMRVVEAAKEVRNAQINSFPFWMHLPNTREAEGVKHRIGDLCDRLAELEKG